LLGLPLPKPDYPNYGQVKPMGEMTVGSFRNRIQMSAPLWKPVK